MVTQYSDLQFFRRVPNDLLARYFESRGIDLEVTFDELKQTEVEPILDAFLKLVNEQQAEIEAEEFSGHPSKMSIKTDS